MVTTASVQSGFSTWKSARFGFFPSASKPFSQFLCEDRYSQPRKYQINYNNIDLHRIKLSGFNRNSCFKQDSLYLQRKDCLAFGLSATDEKSSNVSPSESDQLISKCTETEPEYSEKRFSLVAATSLAFVICNMDKVNMSVAIIPMSEQLGWSASVAGLVQSAFFCGYAVSQLPGGWLAQRFLGRRVLALGVLVWSLGTAIVPPVASAVPLLVLVRLLIGLGEGVAPPAATDLIARSVPANERSRAVATVFGGLNVGSVMGLILAPLCIELFGWESVFFLFGAAGLIWWVYFEMFIIKPGPFVSLLTQGNNTPSAESSRHTPALGFSAAAASPSSSSYSSPLLSSVNSSSSETSSSSNASTASADAAPVSAKGQGAVPWPSFFHSPSVLALIWAHFCHDWGKYSLQSWLPTYYKSELHLTLTQASQIAILSPLASVAFSVLAAVIADRLILKKLDISKVRRLMQIIAFLAPALCLSVVCLLSYSATPHAHPMLLVALLTLGTGSSSFALAGLYCTHQDISPKYAGILLGITNTAGAIPGFLATFLTGLLYDATASWTISLFAPSVFFCLAGALVWFLFASSKPVDFDELLPSVAAPL